MQLALLGDFANINGGQAKVAIDTAVAFAEAGHHVHFCAGSGKPDAALRHPNISVTLLGQNDILSEPNRVKAMVNGLWNMPARRLLKDWLAQFDPRDALLHCHGYAKVLSPAVGPLLTRGPLPTVYTMHEYFLGCPNGGFYDYQRGNICTRKALSTGCLTTHCDARHPAHKIWRVARQATTWGPGSMPRRLRDIIYISETQRRVMAPYLPESARLHHVPNPVPVPDLPPVDAEQNEIFLFVGRLNPEKGGAMFAQAAKSARVKAVFVGDGPEAETIRTLNPDAVITGWQTPAQVQDWIGKARALVFPSLWYEGQPLVPMEAIARGIPVVAGSWSAAHECVTDGETGVIYHEPTAQALEKALSRIGSVGRFDPSTFRTACATETYRRRLEEVYSTVRKAQVKAA